MISFKHISLQKITETPKRQILFLGKCCWNLSSKFAQLFSLWSPKPCAADTEYCGIMQIY